MALYAVHSMTNAARDAARALAVRGATPAQAQTVALSRLTHINAHFTVTATQPPPGSPNRDCTVTITVPRSEVSLHIPGLAEGATLRAEVTMRKEGD